VNAFVLGEGCACAEPFEFYDIYTRRPFARHHFGASLCLVDPVV
jgi:hypothetical protein